MLLLPWLLAEGVVEKRDSVYHRALDELRHVDRFALQPRGLHQQRRQLGPGDLGEGRGGGVQQSQVLAVTPRADSMLRSASSCCCRGFRAGISGWREQKGLLLLCVRRVSCGNS